MTNNTKLLVLSNHYLTFVKDMCEAISRNNYDVDVLVRINYYHLLNVNRRIDLSNLPKNVFVKETPIFYLPIDSQYKKLGERHYKSVETAIEENKLKFDIIHSHFTWSSGHVGAKLKEKYGVPFVVTAHGYDIYTLPFKDEGWKKKIEHVLNSADCIITVSKSNLDCINRLNIKTPVKVLPNGYSNNLFYPMDSNQCRNILTLPLSKNIILTVGNLVEMKGHVYLIKAMSEIIKHRKDVHCIIVGGGKLEHKLEKQIKSAGLQDYVKLVGGKPHDEIPMWMNACDVFVLPSLRESFGVVQLEAMACGKPVVSTRNGGSEDIVINETLGYLAESRNSMELAEKILVALDKKWDNEYISKYVEKYEISEIVKETIKVFEFARSLQ